MADSTARREARRRKLLQSSEERLKKIMQLNEKTIDSAAADRNSYEAVKEQGNSVSTAVTTPPTSLLQVQSEDAQEGEKNVSTLPLESSLEECLHQTDAEESTEGEVSVESSVGQEMDHSMKEEIRELDRISEEPESKLNTDGGSQTVAGTATKKALETADASEDITPRIVQEVDHVARNSSCQNDSITRSCSPTVHSLHPSRQILGSDSLSRSIPASRYIPASSLQEATSSTVQPETPVADVSQEVETSSPAAHTGHFLTTRELFVVLVAILMRTLLALEWFRSFGQQSIIIPFIALEVMFYLNSQTQDPPGGMLVKMLGVVAMISNVSKASIKKFHLILSLVNKFFEDLALYLFAFILTHGALELLSIG